MTTAIILIPIVSGVASYFVNCDRLRNAILLLTASIHFLLSIGSLVLGSSSALGGMLDFDEAGHLLLCVMSFLFLVSSVYAVSYINEEAHGHHLPGDEGFIFADSPRRLFSACLLIFCGTMSLVCAARHLGLLWIGVEATTFASAPLVYFYHNRRSLEATWKYVMICSVGIGFSLIGNLLVMVAFSESAKNSLYISDLLALAGGANRGMLMAAFVFFLIGYGTKAGLVPMHSWLPDAHGESPAFVSSLLSGALLNCAFLGILRLHGICWNAGLGSFSGGLMVFMGLLSVVAAAFFMLSQKDYKRMLAYSSIEHMGIVIIGAGLGGAGVIASMLHLLNHSLTKGMLFLTSGNILSIFSTRKIEDVKGLFKESPASGLLWFAGILAICGTPPSGFFVSEFLLLKEIFSGGKYIVAVVLLFALLLVFGCMSLAVIKMFFGGYSGEKREFRISVLRILTPFLLILCSFFLGVHLPKNLLEFIGKIAGGFQQ